MDILVAISFILLLTVRFFLINFERKEKIFEIETFGIEIPINKRITEFNYIKEKKYEKIIF